MCLEQDVIAYKLKGDGIPAAVIKVYHKRLFGKYIDLVGKPEHSWYSKGLIHYHFKGENIVRCCVIEYSRELLLTLRKHVSSK